MLHKNKQTKNREQSLIVCGTPTRKAKAETGFVFCPQRELLERRATKFDAEHAVLHQKLPGKQLVLLMTTLDSKRSLTQLIVLYNFLDVFMVLLTFFPHFKWKEELDWLPRFSLIKSTAGCPGGQRGKNKKISGNNHCPMQRRWWEARVSRSPVVNRVQPATHHKVTRAESR